MRDIYGVRLTFHGTTITNAITITDISLSGSSIIRNTEYDNIEDFLEEHFSSLNDYCFRFLRLVILVEQNSSFRLYLDNDTNATTKVIIEFPVSFIKYT